MTIYLTTVHRVARPYHEDHRLGCVNTPSSGGRKAGWIWAADNNCWGRHYPGDQAWFSWLSEQAHDAYSCLFATAPDVIGDARETLERSIPWLPEIRRLGFKAGFVAQPGCLDLDVPWDEFDALFLGGTDEWKLGPGARDMVGEARSRGRWVHMGRVNSLRRFHYAAAIGCNSADGTVLAFAPDRNIEKILAFSHLDPSLGVEGELRWDSIAPFATPIMLRHSAHPESVTNPSIRRQLIDAGQLDPVRLAVDDANPDQLDLFTDPNELDLFHNY